jgi:uncharacterized protein
MLNKPAPYKPMQTHVKPSYLFDVNALLALGWDKHEHHSTVCNWLDVYGHLGWASCAITQAGFVRLSAQVQVITGKKKSPEEASKVLSSFLKMSNHSVLPLDFDHRAVVAACTGGIVGHRQITDAYLLTLAIRKGCKLLTFDQGIHALLATEQEREQHLCVLK